MAALFDGPGLAIAGHGPDTLGFIFLAFLLAAAAKGVTGLGFSTCCLPLLTIAIGLKEALPLVFLPSLASNAAVILQAGHMREMARRFRWLYLGAGTGTAIGVAILGAVSGATAGAVLGAVLVAYCAFALSRPAWRLAARLERPLAGPVGLSTGVIAGLTGSQVLPVMPYLLAIGLERERMVTTVNISFTLCSLVMATGLASLGLLGPEELLLSALGIGVAVIGVRLGTRVRKRLAPESFRLAVLVMLAFAGASLILRAV
ncbi:MAG: sulfite exporter TauE/SafE family protein [Pseudomonadota bacterium]